MADGRSVYVLERRDDGGQLTVPSLTGSSPTTTRGATKPKSIEASAPVPLAATVDVVPQRAVPISDLLVAQTFAVVGLVVGLLLDLPGWYGAVAGIAVALVFVVRVRGLSMPRWTFLRLDLWRGRRRKDETEQSEPFDAELPDGSQIGFRWDGKTLMSLVRIEENPQAITVMEPAMTVSGETVSMQMLADCLQQFDITIDSIDVISQGFRSHGHNHIAAVYDAVLGPLPAIAHRSVWVAVRLDPTSCPDAVHRRGGGWEGTLRTAATATRRVANQLADAGLRPQIMIASEIAHATNQLSDGVGLADLDETWAACQKGRFQLTSFSVTPALFTTAGLGSLWTVPSHSTTVCVSLRRDGRDDLIKLRGLARFDGYGRSPVRLPGLRTLPGKQLAALTCSLPLPPPRRPVGGWMFGEGNRAIADLALPASGCGQVIGADEHGRAVALPLFGPRVRRVEMCGTLQLAQQAVLRSMALGARIRVHTSRGDAWQAMVEQVADQNLLMVADRSGPAMQAGSAGNYSVEVFDGTTEQSVRVGVTTVVVKPTLATPSSESDVTLQLLDPDRDIVRVGTRAGAAVVTMVATDDEMRYLTPSFEMAE
jgi:type VII secretion protein EccE